MKETPILFNTEMVQAILEGRKTQTRRIMKNQIVEGNGWWSYPGSRPKAKTATGARSSNVHPSKWHEWPFGMSSPVGRPGDRLWVKETFVPGYYDDGSAAYKADWNSIAAEYVNEPKWKPSIHMPREASRILLEITEVRVERLNDISEEDAMAEGMFFTDYGRKCYHGGNITDVGDCPAPPETHPQRYGWSWKKTESCSQCLGHPKSAFISLWTSIYGPGSWNANPWVWVIEFKRIDHE